LLGCESNTCEKACDLKSEFPYKEYHEQQKSCGSAVRNQLRY